jgi:DNA-binding transcriptional MerR regulator
MLAEAPWTLDELVRRVAAALAGPAYPGAPNGRIRDVPDRRAVRWYTTIGLVDPPAARQGRTALYGPRHLLQIVAVKRRQAEGRSLANIQAELAGATDKTLRLVATVPDQLIATQQEPEWVSEPDAAATAEQPQAKTPRAERKNRFWAELPNPDAAVSSPHTADRGGADSVTVLAGVPLPGGALILLPRRPDPPKNPEADTISAIQAAARPLLDLLADRGLLALEGETRE